MTSCERPLKRSASEALPSSESNRYSLVTRTHGSSCRRRASSSLRRVNSFSASSSASRAASHSSRVPVLCVIIALLSFLLLDRPCQGRRAPRVDELRCPIVRAARQKVEDVPKGAEVIAGFEGRIGHAQNPLAVELEHRDAGQPATALGAIAHVLGEGRALVAHHRKLPAAACGE